MLMSLKRSRQLRSLYDLVALTVIAKLTDLLPWSSDTTDAETFNTF